MRPVVAGESHLRPLDWLVLPTAVSRPAISFPSGYFRLEDELVATSVSPWSTIPLYYDGLVPLCRQLEQHAMVRIFRVTRDLVPQPQGAAP